jgi:hypothetical protein
VLHALKDCDCVSSCPFLVAGCKDLFFPNCDCSINGGTEYWCYDDFRECRGKLVVPTPETENPKPYRPDGTVLTLVNPQEVDTNTIASTKTKSKNVKRPLVAIALLAGAAAVAYRRLRVKYMPGSSGGAGTDIAEYELGAYVNSLDDF